MTADQALRDPWIALSVASSNLKDLHRSFSQNWLKSSSRLNSAKSNASQNWVKNGSRLSSANSNASQNSTRSLRSGRSKRKNSSTIPQETTVQSEEIKQSGTKSKDLRDSNVKLTKHSVINEDDREFFNSTNTEHEGEVAVLKVTTEWDNNWQHGVRQGPDFNGQTIDSTWKVQSMADDSNEEIQTKPIPIVRNGAQLSHLVLRDNFFEEQRNMMTGLYDENDFIEAGRLAGAEGIVFVNASCINRHTEIDVTLSSTTTGSIQWSIHSENLTAHDIAEKLTKSLNE